MDEEAEPEEASVAFIPLTGQQGIDGAVQFLRGAGLRPRQRAKVRLGELVDGR
jgi:hypothetical protein